MWFLFLILERTQRASGLDKVPGLLRLWVVSPCGLLSGLRQCGCAFSAAFFRAAEEGAEKVPRRAKGVPQRLKPRSQQETCGTAKAVPLSKTEFFSTL